MNWFLREQMRIEEEAIVRLGDELRESGRCPKNGTVIVVSTPCARGTIYDLWQDKQRWLDVERTTATFAKSLAAEVSVHG